MTGYSVRQRRLYVVRLQQQAASSAVADERLRIARELHDVVAHSMSVIAVQAGYGQYVIDDSPDGAREALGAIQVTSREALDEMRRMLGVLRQQDVTPAAGQATPGAPRRAAIRGPRAVRPGGRRRRPALIRPRPRRFRWASGRRRRERRETGPLAASRPATAAAVRRRWPRPRGWPTSTG